MMIILKNIMYIEQRESVCVCVSHPPFDIDTILYKLN